MRWALLALIIAYTLSDRAMGYIVVFGQVRSIESGIAHSRSVVRATTLGGGTGATRRIHVNEVLMGSVPTEMEVGFRPDIFLAPTHKVVGKEYILGIDELSICQMVIPMDGSAKAVNLDLRLLSEREEIIPAVREIVAYASTHARAKEEVGVLIYDLERGYEAPEHQIIFPLDERLTNAIGNWSVNSNSAKRFAAIDAMGDLWGRDVSLKDWMVATAKPMIMDAGRTSIQGKGKYQYWKYGVRERAVWLLRRIDPGIRGESDVGPMVLYHPMNPLWLGLPILWALLVIGAVLWPKQRAMALSSCSLLGIAGVTVLWARSYTIVDEVMVSPGRSHYEIGSYRGGIQLNLVPMWNRDRGLLSGHVKLGSCEDDWALPAEQVDSRRAWAGFALVSSDNPWPGRPYPSFRMARIPDWFLMAILVLPGLFSARAVFQHFYRKRTGRCLDCGYDLRETPQRCPECGKASGTM